MNITALIVTYNRIEKLKNSVKATLELPFTHIVIVNNNSTDSTQSWLEQINDQRVKILSTQANIGGAGGFKYGVAYIVNHLPCDWVVFYDDDAWPAANFIEEVTKHGDKETDVLCSKVLDLDNNICSMNVAWKKIPHTLQENINYLFSKENYTVGISQAEKVVAFSFVGCVIRYEVLIKTYNYIISDLFIYFDDVYYSYQLYLNGFSLQYQPTMIFYHDINARAGSKMPAWKIYYLMRNMLRSFHIFKKDNFFSVSAVLLRLIKYLCMSGKAQNKLCYLKYYFKGILDGMRNIGGNRH